MKFIILALPCILLFSAKIYCQRNANIESSKPVNHDISEGLQRKAGVEQTFFGKRPAPKLLASFDGLGEGFVGPQGTATMQLLFSC